MTARAVTLAGYLLILVAMVVWELRCRKQHSLTFGRLLAWMTRSRVGATSLFLLWAWIGWHLFVRGSVTYLGP